MKFMLPIPFNGIIRTFIILIIRTLVVGILFFSPSIKAVGNEELKIGVVSEFETLNPILNSTAVGNYMMYFSYRPMVYLNNENKFAPLIVKKIPNLNDKSVKVISENNLKKIITEWEFVDGIKWGDGVPITCKDLKFSWQVGLSKNITLSSRDEYENIETIEWDPKSPTKCSVKFKEAKWDFFINMPSVLPSHLEEEIFNKFSKEKEGYDRNTLYQKDPTKKGLWNGPYRVSEVKLGSHIILVPNENFYGKKPKIKKIVIQIIPNSGTLEANLRSKNLDKISRMGLTMDQALAFEKKIKSENLPYKMIFQDGVTYGHMDVNLSHPILSDLSVRKALSYGLNKEELVKSVFEGKVTVAHHLISPLDRLYTEDKKIITIYESDKRKAKKLLDEAGWKLGADNYRYKNGQKLSFTLVTSAGLKANETIQAMLQSQWKQIGVDLKLKTELARFLFSEILPKRKFDMAFFSWSSFPEISSKAVLRSNNIPNEKNTWTGQNFTGFKSDKVDKLVDDYESEFDFEKRKKISYEILKEYTEQIPVISLYFRGESAVIPKDMKNFKLTGHKFYESLNAEDWEF
ncbi:MAG: peptide ABC transporter substrate-binding protein [Deltaproteobacteria bacterium]|nr:peptide ABC transporter substrate-binding protein [Deltaproteobacteria bacterium]